MIDLNEHKITDETIRRWDNVLRHLHAFAREVKLTATFFTLDEPLSLASA